MFRLGVFSAVIFCWLGLSINFLAQEAAQPQRVSIPEADQRLHVVNKVAPNYPPLARQARIQGTVVLQLDIDTSGNVGNVALISGHPMLAPAAVTAVKQWKYEPYVVDANAVPVETTVRVNFTLSDKPSSEKAAAGELAPHGVAGDVPGGIPPGTPGVIGAIVSSTPTSTPRIALPSRVRVSQGVSTGLIVSKVNPVYPVDARRGRIQGSVIMKAVIDKEGNVVSLELVSGHPMLADAAIEAVRQWKYKPYLLNRQAVEVETQIQVNFTLSGG